MKLVSTNYERRFIIKSIKTYFISLLCTICIIGASSPITYAYDNSVSTIHIDGSNETIQIVEDDNYRNVNIINNDTKEVQTLSYDKKTQILTSSITGNSIDLSSNSSAARSVSSKETKYISYASIKKVAGNVATIANVTAAILTYSGAAAIGEAAGIVGATADLINHFTSPSTKHGIKLSIKVTKYYRTRAGHRAVYKIKRDITGASKY